jgi:hypothetical protein
MTLDTLGAYAVTLTNAVRATALGSGPPLMFTPHH